MSDMPTPPNQPTPVDPSLPMSDDETVVEDGDEANEEAVVDDTHPALDSNVDTQETYDKGLAGNVEGLPDRPGNDNGGVNDRQV